jgi:hypothetical protein
MNVFTREGRAVLGAPSTSTTVRVLAPAQHRGQAKEGADRAVGRGPKGEARARALSLAVAQWELKTPKLETKPTLVEAPLAVSRARTVAHQ